MDYSGVISSSEAALKNVGLELTLRKSSGGTYDPATGEIVGDTATDYTLYGILTSPYQNIRYRFRDSSRIQMGDKIVIVGTDSLPSGTVPSPGDEVIISGIVWIAVEVESVEPGNDPILHKILIRK